MKSALPSLVCFTCHLLVQYIMTPSILMYVISRVMYVISKIFHVTSKVVYVIFGVKYSCTF